MGSENKHSILTTSTAMDTIKDAANSASESVQKGFSSVSKEGNKQVAKDSNAPLGDRASAAKDAASDKASEQKHEIKK